MPFLRGCVAAAVLAAGCAGCATGLVDRMAGISDVRKLQQIGTPGQATILRIWDTGVTINHDPVVGFLLELRGEADDAYQARTRARISRLDVPRFQPGAVVPIRIDPADRLHVAIDAYR